MAEIVADDSGNAQMTADEIIAEAMAVFAAVERPAHFTNYEHCSECREHDDVLLAHDPQTITRDALGSMGWDPITFSTDAGFRYYLPGLIRILLTETGYDSYCEQFFWHAIGGGDYDRSKACTPQEKAVVARALRFLLENRAAEMDAECLSDELLMALEKWS